MTEYLEEPAEIVRAEHLGGTMFRLGFADGFDLLTDLTPLLRGEAFDELRETNTIDQAYVDHDQGTIAWPNGADLDPDVLRSLPPVSPGKQAAVREFDVVRVVGDIKQVVTRVSSRDARTWVVTPRGHRKKVRASAAIRDFKRTVTAANGGDRSIAFAPVKGTQGFVVHEVRGSRSEITVRSSTPH